MNLVNKQESNLFKVNLILAVFFWSTLIFSMLGFGIFFIAAGVVFYLFSQSALIAYFKGNSILIGPEQFPDLHRRIVIACEKLKMKEPEAYLHNGNGLLNAFATKFLNRDYIILMSDLLESFDENDSAVDFYIGHELGHIHRKHLQWWPVFLPLSFLPLLMPAYRRACESTCDQYGAFCCETKEDAVRGLALLATGGKRLRSFSPAAFISQIKESGGFWMSFHELTGSYPWLNKRVAMVQEGERANEKFPKRPLMAKIIGLFCPGFITGGFLPFILLYFFIIIVGLVAPRTGLIKGIKETKENELKERSDLLEKLNKYQG